MDLLKQRGDTQPTSKIISHPLTTNQLFLCNRFFLEPKVQHSQVCQQLSMLIYDSFYNFTFETEKIYLFFFEYLFPMSLSWWWHHWVFWVWFRCVCRAQSQKVWCAHQHQVKHCRVSDPYGYISFCELNLKQVIFRLCKIVLIREWRYLSWWEGSWDLHLVNTPSLGIGFRDLGRSTSIQQSRGYFLRWLVHFFTILIEQLCFWKSFMIFLIFWRRWVHRFCSIYRVEPLQMPPSQ